MRHRDLVTRELVDAYETHDSYSSEGRIEARWYKAITDNQALLLEALLDIRDLLHPAVPTPAPGSKPDIHGEFTDRSELGWAWFTLDFDGDRLEPQVLDGSRWHAAGWTDELVQRFLRQQLSTVALQATFDALIGRIVAGEITLDLAQQLAPHLNGLALPETSPGSSR